MSGGSAPDDSQKTEEPTPKKLRTASEKGQVALSKEVVSASVVLVFYIFIASTIPMYARELSHLMDVVATAASDKSELFFFSAIKATKASFHIALMLVIPAVALLWFTTIASSFFQIGAIFATEKLEFSFNKLDIGENLKNIFSKKALIDFVKNIIKICSIGIVYWLVVKVYIQDFLNAPIGGLPVIFFLTGYVAVKIMVFTALIFLGIAAIDLAVEKYLFHKQMMMTMEEVKKEFKEMEGSPEIKSMRRQMFAEIISSQESAPVKDASLVVKNPTHYAVALYYDVDKCPVPIVVAKGQGYIARAILKVAKESDVPIMENIFLARSLYNEADVWKYVPTRFLRPVAELFLLLQEIKNQNNINSE